MTNKQFFHLLSDVPPTEPFTTFDKNALALQELIMTAEPYLKKGRKDAEALLVEIEKGRRISKNSIDGLMALAEEVQGKINEIKANEHVFAKSDKLLLEYKKALDDLRESHNGILNDIKYVRDTVNQWDSTEDQLLQILPTRNVAFVLMPMAFVYLVAIWDAFITDTTRCILRIHPQLISDCTTNIQLSKSDVWNLGTNQDIREYLIELEVRKLTEERKKLIDTFRDYWGIDFQKSLVNLEDIVEIRARRDVWVHNSGVVNKQYERLVGDATTFEKGQIAEITYEYFEESLVKLIVLAGFIHKTAFSKHYSKLNQVGG